MRKLLKSFKTEINPTVEQKIKINKIIGTCRYVYNFYLGHNKALYDKGEKFMTGKSFSVWLNNEYILRWLNQRGVVVIPKSVRKERMMENLDIFNFTLTDEEMKDIAGLDTGKSPIYDDMDLPTVRGIGTHKIHD